MGGEGFDSMLQPRVVGILYGRLETLGLQPSTTNSAPKRPLRATFRLTCERSLAPTAKPILFVVDLFSERPRQ